ncbi:MAG: potassium channel family protein [Phycisphaerales bacterium]|nr:potassium channel family protein [Phycisphaerales bacterium]
MDKPLADPKATSLRLVILILSVFSLLIIAAMELLPMEPETYRLLGIIDLLICIVFFSDFLGQLYKAESRWRYMYTWGWLDLIASIPSVDAFRWARTARIVRISRVLRAIRSIRYLLRILGYYRRRSAVFVTALVVFLSLAIGSMAILHFELGAEGSNITNAEDALWWAWVTITTVGYGDYSPVTSGGRLVAAVLMFVGVGLFSSLSGLIASWLLDSSKDPES